MSRSRRVDVTVVAGYGKENLVKFPKLDASRERCCHCCSALSSITNVAAMMSVVGLGQARHTAKLRLLDIFSCRPKKQRFFCRKDYFLETLLITTHDFLEYLMKGVYDIWWGGYSWRPPEKHIFKIYYRKLTQTFVPLSIIIIHPVDGDTACLVVCVLRAAVPSQYSIAALVRPIALCWIVWFLTWL